MHNARHRRGPCDVCDEYFFQLGVRAKISSWTDDGDNSRHAPVRTQEQHSHQQRHKPREYPLCCYAPCRGRNCVGVRTTKQGTWKTLNALLTSAAKRLCLAMQFRPPQAQSKLRPRKISSKRKIRQRRDGGKRPATMLLLPVNPATKRAKFLDWSLAKPRSIAETMTQFNISRENVFSYWMILHRRHGIGYSFRNGVFTVLLPAGCTPASIFGKWK